VAQAVRVVPTGALVEQAVPGVVLVERFLLLKATSSKCSLVAQVEMVRVVHRTQVEVHVVEASFLGWKVAQVAPRAM